MTPATTLSARICVRPVLSPFLYFPYAGLTILLYRILGYLSLLYNQLIFFSVSLDYGSYDPCVPPSATRQRHHTSRSKNPLHNHGHGPTQGPQGGASEIAPSQPLPSLNARLPFTAQYSAPPLIPLDPKAVGSNGALNSAPKLITTATSSAPLPGICKTSC